MNEQSKQEEQGTLARGDGQERPKEERPRKRLSRYSRSENAPRMQMMERDKRVVMAVWGGQDLPVGRMALSGKLVTFTLKYRDARQ